jgi:hypothetical protein
MRCVCASNRVVGREAAAWPLMRLCARCLTISMLSSDANADLREAVSDSGLPAFFL